MICIGLGRSLTCNNQILSFNHIVFLMIYCCSKNMEKVFKSTIPLTGVRLVLRHLARTIRKTVSTTSSPATPSRIRSKGVSCRDITRPPTHTQLLLLHISSSYRRAPCFSVPSYILTEIAQEHSKINTLLSANTRNTIIADSIKKHINCKFFVNI